MATPDPTRVRSLVYETFAREGRAPSIAELSRLTDSSADSVRRVLAALAESHSLVLTADGDTVRMAHPFTAAPMAFVVTPLDGHDDRRWWGGCAWDSFGISAALDIDVRIDTACPQCGRHLSVATGPDQAPPPELAIRFPRPADQWWDDVVATCTMIRMFCDHDHAQQWTREHTPGTGRIVQAATIWRLSRPWYGDRLDPGFRAHSRELNQTFLTDCGLTGPFWQLP